jgi:hypothetical protein
MIVVINGLFCCTARGTAFEHIVEVREPPPPTVGNLFVECPIPRDARDPRDYILRLRGFLQPACASVPDEPRNSSFGPRKTIVRPLILLDPDAMPPG